MAFANSEQAFPAAAEQAVFLDGQDIVLGAGWLEAAFVGDEGADSHLIKSDTSDSKAGGNGLDP